MTTTQGKQFASYDVVVISTAPREFRDPELHRDVRLVVDTRNLVAEVASAARVVKA